MVVGMEADAGAALGGRYRSHEIGHGVGTSRSGTNRTVDVWMSPRQGARLRGRLRESPAFLIRGGGSDDDKIRATRSAAPCGVKERRPGRVCCSGDAPDGRVIGERPAAPNILRSRSQPADRRMSARTAASWAPKSHDVP